MNGLYALLAPVALLVPIFGQSEPVPSAVEAARLDPNADALPIAESSPSGRNWLDAPRSVPVQNQVRIEQRVIVRVSPRSQVARQNLMAELPQQPLPQRFEERKMEKCLPVAGIAGVQTGSGNRLLLFLRDRRIVTARLEKSCRARDFYSGFYVERNKDGKICAERDKLQSRSGANCEIKRLRQLVKAED
ncbi:hypothetical protein [Altererythrobacter sp.]|uniref:hypothetical protein n=1 Tax=Altererythrobacter sp. TaxID=1872480 RepID=UPI003CFEFDFE